MNHEPSVLLHSFNRQRDTGSFSFSGLIADVIATSIEQVIPALEQVEGHLARGFHAAGFIAYEASAAFEPALTTRTAGDFPLLWFGIFEKRGSAVIRAESQGLPSRWESSSWQSDITAEDYVEAVNRIRDYIAAGDVYQVNFTFRRRFNFSGDPRAFYRDICRTQPASFCAFLDLGRYQLLSASPELFIRLEKGKISVRPMKGTSLRGRWPDEDKKEAQNLKNCPKELAENLMILDLLRNDLGKIAETGSVKVESMFDLETLPSLHQMTSSISATIRKKCGLVELFRAVFPCGSITGAPKKRAMEIIRELECSPRGIYTGSIGYLSPAGPEGGYEGAFSVAIRTIILDSETGEGEMGVGSGITWDSAANLELEECLAKGSFARRIMPEFKLVETMLYHQEAGYFLFDEHLARLGFSASYFGFSFRRESVRKVLIRRAAQFSGNRKVRLLLSAAGIFTMEDEAIADYGIETDLPAVFSGTAVNSKDPFLFHKTTNRDLYRREAAKRKDGAEVLFLNEREEVTEGANTNIVARLNGVLVTPPVHCGLLPGVFRGELLHQGLITESVIDRKELEDAEEIFLVNSVRKWRKAKLVGFTQ